MRRSPDATSFLCIPCASLPSPHSAPSRRGTVILNTHPINVRSPHSWGQTVDSSPFLAFFLDRCWGRSALHHGTTISRLDGRHATLYAAFLGALLRPFLTICALLSLGACGLSETRFQAEVLSEFCLLNEDCTQTVDQASCIDALRAVDRTACDYDPSAAKTCEQELETEAACVDNGDIGTSTLDYPSVCDEVYSGCEPLYSEPYPAVVTD